MSGSKQNTIMLFKPETTSGTSAAPTAAADAVLFWVDDLDVKIEQRTVARNVVTGGFGAPDKLPYSRRGVVTFTTDLQAAGSLGVAPAWGDMLICAGFAEAVTATTRVDYTPVSTGIKTATMQVEWNDVLYLFVYCAVDLVGLEIIAGQAPKLKWQARGLVSTDPAAGALTAPTLTSWKRPQAVSTANTAKINVGAVTYASGAVSGGTQYTFKSLTIALANDIQDPDLVGQETVRIYGRAPSAEIVLDATPAQHAAFLADLNLGTARAFGLVHGTTAGSKVGVYAPNGVLEEVGEQADGDVLMSRLKMALPPVAGNDELRIFCV